MFGIRFEKFTPVTYVVHYKSGKVKSEGPGLAFFHYAPTSAIVAVPLSSVDLPFVFHATTSDFQEVTVQGQLTYRIAEPRKTATLLDFTVDHRRGATGSPLEVLGLRLVNEAQTATIAFALARPLRDVLRSPEGIAAEVLAGLQHSAAIAELGVAPLGVSVLQVAPTPEMARALEAEAREALQQQADRAIYDRRNLAVDQERRIKENELATDIAVEAKKRQIREAQMDAEIAVEEKRRVVRETQMAAEIAVEHQRGELLEWRTGNDRAEADARAYSLEVTLKPMAAVDWRVLMALAKGGIDPAGTIALAFQELAANAGKISNLSVTPELLQALLDSGKKK